MTNLEKVMQALKECSHDEECSKCPYVSVYCCQSVIMEDATALLEKMYRAWQTVKFAAIETAQNNAGDNKDVYGILMFMARLMDNQEKRWNDA